MIYEKYQSLNSLSSRNRFAVILAGGDGVRLRSFVRELRGDSLPKQYVKFFSDQSLLEATVQRTQKLFPQEKQFVVVTEHHLDYPEVEQQLANCPKVAIVVQPANRDTGLGLLLPLALLYHRQPNATVSLFPSDHFIAKEDSFLSHVDAACDFVERENSKIVLLGIQPNSTETEYGYILAGNRRHNAFPYGVLEVERFIEKPNAILAKKLILRGGLWNTMVMIFKINSLLQYIREIRPQTCRGFEQLCHAVGRPDFSAIVKQVFAQSEPFNLSSGFLEALAARRGADLLVLPVPQVHWSDWGSAERILKSLDLAENDGYKIACRGELYHSLQTSSVAGGR